MTFLLTSLIAVLVTFQSPPAPEVMPQGALAREKPKLWWFSFEVTVNMLAVPNNDRPFRMPLIVQGSWSELAQRSLQVESLTGHNRSKLLEGEQTTTGTGVQGEQMIRAPVPLGPQRFSVIKVAAEVVCWNSVVNEELATATTWPAEWPSAVAKSLQPQALIESDEPIFKETIDSLFGPNLRMTPPWLAAKAITQYTCNNVTVTGSRTLRGRNQMRGLNMQGALATATTGRGTRADLTCTCIAMLRAAGIPARPVVGIAEDVDDGDELTTWAEFYLPGSGWVPFSPWQMQNAGVRTWKLNRSWRYFGNWNSLNENVPLAWSFAPGDGSTSHDSWALWGWTRAIPGETFPLPDRYSSQPGNPRQATSVYHPSTVLIHFVSGGSLGEAQLSEWRAGNRRPLQRRTSRQ